MKVLVTGGAGFIGSHVVDALVEAGHEVVVVDNFWEHGGGRVENVHPQAKLYQIDIRDWNTLSGALVRNHPEVVYHLAAQNSVSYSTKNPAYDASVNVVGMENLLETCTAHQVRKVVFSSTSAVYGTVQQMPIHEDTPMSTPESPYGITKFAGEQYLRYWHKAHGLQYTILRYANVYGPRQDPSGEAGVIGIFADRMLRKKPVRIDWDGEQSKDYVYVGDVARANLLALERGDGQAYCIGTGKATSVNELYRLLSEATETMVGVIEAPKRPGDVRLFAFDSSKARQELGWEPQVSLKEGLQQTVSYYQERIAHERGTV